MYYYKQLEENGAVSHLITCNKALNITNSLTIEITESEYNSLLSEIQEKSTLVDQLYNGDITIDDVPIEWQEEIQRRVDEMIAEQGERDEQEIPADEFQAMVEEVL